MNDSSSLCIRDDGLSEYNKTDKLNIQFTFFIYSPKAMVDITFIKP